MSLIAAFDPWQNNQCTCPKKLTFNPYTGCNHDCIYCYASSYIPNFSACRPKKDLLKRLEHETAKLKGETISIANSSDPYPPIEKELSLTRRSLEVLSKSNCRIQIITKSTLITRDKDLLVKAPVTVAFTITTDNDSLAKRLEPNAPSSTERMEAVAELISAGILVLVRIDPIIPFVNEDTSKLVAKLGRLGVKQVTASTYKVKSDNWRRFCKAMPEYAERLKPLYFDVGEKRNGNIMLNKDLRLKVLQNVRYDVVSQGLRFAVCREGLSHLNTATCDGSWLMPLLEEQNPAI